MGDALSKYCQPTEVREVSAGLFWGWSMVVRILKIIWPRCFYLLSQRQKVKEWDGEEDEIGTHFSNLHVLINSKNQKPFESDHAFKPPHIQIPNVLKPSHPQTLVSFFQTFLSSKPPHSFPTPNNNSYRPALTALKPSFCPSLVSFFLVVLFILSHTQYHFINLKTVKTKHSTNCPRGQNDSLKFRDEAQILWWRCRGWSPTQIS